MATPDGTIDTFDKPEPIDQAIRDRSDAALAAYSTLTDDAMSAAATVEQKSEAMMSGLTILKDTFGLVQSLVGHIEDLQAQKASAAGQPKPPGLKQDLLQGIIGIIGTDPASQPAAVAALGQTLLKGLL